MRLLFLRHAHALSQVDSTIVAGRAAVQPLTEEGLSQARAVGAALRGWGIKRIYASPLLRAQQTAQAISNALDIPFVNSHMLIERSHGSFEGRPKAEVYTPEVIRDIHADQLRWKPEGGESLEEVQVRLREFLSEFEGQGDDESPCLIITHLMVLWALFHLCTECHHAILPKLKVDNVGLVEIAIPSPDALRLVRWNQRVLKEPDVAGDGIADPAITALQP